jgi:hypothetical protein
MTEPAPADVQLVLFEVAGTLLAADATQIVRIDRAAPDAHALCGIAAPGQGVRALVYRRPGGGGEAQLRVDSIHGVVTAAVESLRRMPAAARAFDFALGFWLGKDRPVLLVDLCQTQPPFP